MAEENRFKVVLSFYDGTRSPQIRLMEGNEQVTSVVFKWGTPWHQVRTEIFNFKRISGFLSNGCSMEPLLEDAKRQWDELGFEND